MKLRKIIIHNIASIEEATIDFENGPLAADSRFLICGPTGTGKTTILDCICLALYCTTPRLKAAAKESYTDPNDHFANNNRDEISIDDSRMLMRRGAVDAYVYLYFTDKDDTPLKAVWSCRRSRNRAEGTIQNCEWYLCNDKEVVIAQRSRVMKEEIPQRIGLTFEQFCRTTLLAQGDFTKFLKSGESEKAEILEKLTGTEIYSEISRRIHVVFGQKEEVCKDIRSQLGGVQLLTDEAIADIQQQQEQLAQQRVEELKNEQRWMGIVGWWKKRNEAEEELRRQSLVEEASRQKLQTAAFTETRQLLADWDATVTQREQWKAMRQGQRKLETLEEEEKQLRHTYARLCGGKLKWEEQLAHYQKEQAELQQFLEKNAGHQKLYQQVDLVASLLQQQSACDAAIVLADQRQQEATRQLAEQQDRRKALAAELLECEQEKNRRQTAYSAALEQLQAMDYQQLLTSQTKLSRQREQILSYGHLLEQFGQEQKVGGELRQEWEEEKRLLAMGEGALATADRLLQQLEASQKVQEEVYEKQKMACEDLMEEYRKQLSVGDICPLCGHQIEKLETDEHFHSMLAPVEEALRNIRQQVEKAKEEKFKCAAEVDNHRKLSVRAQRLLLESEKKLGKFSTSLAEGPCGERYFHTENPQEQLTADLTMVGQKWDHLQLQLKAVGEQQKLVERLHKELETGNRALLQTQQALSEAEKRVLATTAKRDAEVQQKQTQVQHLEQIAKGLDELVPAQKREELGADFLPRLRTAAQRYQQAQEKVRELETTISRWVARCEQMVKTKEEIDRNNSAWKEVEPQEMDEVEDLPQQWSTLNTDVAMHRKTLSDTSVLVSDLDAALQTYFGQENVKVDEARLSVLVAHPAEEMEQIRKEQQTLREEWLRHQNFVVKAKELYDAHLKARPEMDEGVTQEDAEEEWLRKKQALSLSDQRLGELRQQLTQDSANHKRFDKINQQLQEAEAEAARWGKLHELFGSGDGKKFRNIAQSYVLTQLLINANQYLRQFTDRYEMLCQPGSLTILLRDHEAGDITRPTTTISGGEGFLISLSLALGLSSLSRASISMDTLFIDEGFGTLDSTYLSAVMDALERLHQMGGKRVGIISHVESLKDRITTQIQVSRVNTTLSKVEVLSLL